MPHSSYYTKLSVGTHYVTKQLLWIYHFTEISYFYLFVRLVMSLLCITASYDSVKKKSAKIGWVEYFNLIYIFNTAFQDFNDIYRTHFNSVRFSYSAQYRYTTWSKILLIKYFSWTFQFFVLNPYTSKYPKTLCCLQFQKAWIFEQLLYGYLIKLYLKTWFKVLWL